MNEIYEKYYMNQLSQVERQKFENQIKEDKSLADDYEVFVLIQEHLSSGMNIDKALSSLDEIHHTTKPKTKITIISHRITIAATLILVAAAIFLMRPKGPSSNQELFAQNYTPANVSLVTKSDNQQEAMAKLSELYNTKNYSQALAHYQKVKEQLPDDPRITLLASSLYIETAFYQKARLELKELEKNSDFQTAYHWYTGLTHLAENDLKNAKSNFTKIPQSSNYYKKAQEILNTFKK